ncbi:pancreatic triacylglycerol lipase-like isoform X3 [Apis florea]|uniref:pancreatic triacylglycerol lipase-like isoform X3 n=1 Tax=Apis florea TaxID=7463 RepID=UPI0012FE9382|nr:pancreatic triacylglycerol lipase-like isoform X3 [Apis florea]
MTWWFAKVLIKLFIFFTISNHIILTESSKLNILDYVKRNFYNFHTNNSKDFIFTLSNSSNRNNNRISFKSNQVDCFGLGKRLAGILEWFFLNNSNGTNTLDVQFFLSSRRQPKRVEVMTGKQFGLEWTDFQIERPTVIIVHGFLSHGQELWINEMEKSFLLWNDVNIIVVDWSAGGNTWNYYKAAVNTKIIGYQIARFLEYITNATSAQNDFNNWGQLHLVGHSLGAHICGFAAKELKRKQNKWKILRITGLDPAQPCFRNVDSSMKLHKSDASFVDVIHTNGRLLSKIGLGLPEPIELSLVARSTLRISNIYQFHLN